MYRDPVQSLEAPLLPSSATAMRPLRVGMIGTVSYTHLTLPTKRIV